MYIYQLGKLYAQTDGEKLVGVDVYSDKVLIVKNTETHIGEEYEILLPVEAYARFNIKETPYIFPREVEKKDGTTGQVKRTTRKSTNK